MPYVLLFCSNGNRKWIQFGSKIEFTKMRTKNCCVHIFKHSLNRRTVPLILEFDEAIVDTLVKFKCWSTSSKNERVFEKTNMISCLFFRKLGDLLSWKSSLCWNLISLQKGKCGLSSSQRTSNTIGTRKGQKKYDNDAYDDDDDDDYDHNNDNDDYNVFSLS